MDIRAFANLCYRIAKGESVPLDQELRLGGSEAVSRLLKQATEQRVTPLIVHYIFMHPDQLSLSKEVKDRIAVSRPMLATARALKFKAQLLEIDAYLTGTKIQPVLLKGAIQLFSDLYSSIGLRYMADIDVLSTDPEFIPALEKMGYDFAFAEDVIDKQSGEVEALKAGEHHLAPRARAHDITTIEPHISAVAVRHAHLVPQDFETNTQAAPGCNNLRIPSAENYLIHTLIHSISHDRDAIGSGLVLRGLLECELIYERLSAEQRQNCEKHFKSAGSAGYWNAWRALADWTFHDAKSARFQSLKAFLLISEFELRSKSSFMVLAISTASRFLALLDHRYWSSQTYMKHLGRYQKRAFWTRIFQKAIEAIKK